MQEAPEEPFGGRRVWSAEEQDKVVRQWNATASEYRRDVSVHELISAHTEADPDAVAVAAGGRQLSYGELEGRSNQLAQYLRGCGVERGSLVAG